MKSSDSENAAERPWKKESKPGAETDDYDVQGQERDGWEWVWKHLRAKEARSQCLTASLNFLGKAGTKNQ